MNLLTLMLSGAWKLGHFYTCLVIINQHDTKTGEGSNPNRNRLVGAVNEYNDVRIRAQRAFLSPKAKRTISDSTMPPDLTLEHFLT
jgi:hypothetical protein